MGAPLAEMGRAAHVVTPAVRARGHQDRNRMSLVTSLLMHGLLDRKAMPPGPCPSGRTASVDKCILASSPTNGPAPAFIRSDVESLSSRKIAAPKNLPPSTAALANLLKHLICGA